MPSDTFSSTYCKVFFVKIRRTRFPTVSALKNNNTTRYKVFSIPWNIREMR